MVNEVLGECVCPVCKSEYPQEIRKAKTGKPYLNCDECGVQIFARQPASVKILRGLAALLGQKPDSLSVSVKQPEAVPVLAGQGVEKVPEKIPPKPAPALAQKPKPAPVVMTEHEEKTIFDWL